MVYERLAFKANTSWGLRVKIRNLKVMVYLQKHGYGIPLNSVYGTQSVLLLYFGTVVAGPLLWSEMLLALDLRAENKWFYGPLISMSLGLCFVLQNRPRLLLLSRWRPRWSDLVVGISCGVAIKSLLLLFVSDPVKFLAYPYVTSDSFFQIAIAGSLIEETLVRGVFLRSLLVHLSTGWAVLVIVLLGTLAHAPYVLFAVGVQLVFSVLYVAMGDSLAVCIAAHIASNALVYLPVGEFFKRWHIYTIFRI